MTQPEGNVQLTRGRRTQVIREDMLLVVGDAVRVNGNGTAVVYVAAATRYVVNVYDKDESVVCTEGTAETRLALPDRCKLLAAGDYKWDVTAQIGEQVSDNPALYDATSFTVVNESQAAEISAALEHARTVAADGGADAQSVYVSVLMESKLYPQAETVLLRTLEQSPTDQALWALLMETYAQMKRWRSREAARTISVGNPTADVVRAYSLRLKRIAPESLDLAMILNSMGALELDAGRYDGARARSPRRRHTPALLLRR